MKSGLKLKQILNLGVQHALYDKNGAWYHKLKEFPGVLFDKSGYIIFQTKEDFANDLYIKHSPETNHIHILKGGISRMAGYIYYSSEELQSIYSNDDTRINNDIYTIPHRENRIIEQIIRNRSLVNELKSIYNNECQICGTTIYINSSLQYSEIHHIKPIGRPHNGPDDISNMLCVCPNHHVMLDFGSLLLDTMKLKSLKHNINSEFIRHHNDVCCKHLK